MIRMPQRRMPLCVQGLQMKTIVPTFPLALLFVAATSAAMAQTNFQLPRECSERQNVDPNKCVIQDGPPPLPRVHRMPLNNVQPAAATPSAAPAAASSSNAAGFVPSRKASR
jgi:hypothetical protein